jgi:hypothetical protein
MSCLSCAHFRQITAYFSAKCVNERKNSRKLNERDENPNYDRLCPSYFFVANFHKNENRNFAVHVVAEAFP